MQFGSVQMPEHCPLHVLSSSKAHVESCSIISGSVFSAKRMISKEIPALICHCSHTNVPLEMITWTGDQLLPIRTEIQGKRSC